MLCFFLIYPKEAFAKLWINEFFSYGSDDWVEIYNDNSDPVNLGTYQLRDETESHNVTLSGDIASGGFFIVEYNNYLNIGGDTIKLVSVNDESNVLDQVQYGSSGNDVLAPKSGQSAGRSSDGGSQWVIFLTDSKENSNNDSSVVPTITPTPSKTPTPTNSPTPKKTPTPTKAPTATKIPTVTKVPTLTKSSQTSTKKSGDANSEEGDEDTFAVAKITKSASLSGYPTAVLGASNAAKSKLSTTPKVKKRDILVKEASTTSPVIWFLIGGALLLLVCGILVFLKMKKRKAE